MNIKSNKVLSMVFIAIAGIVLLLSTLAMSPSQTTATPTSTVTVTNTELPTATPTLTPTITLSPTPAIAQEVNDSLQDDFPKIQSSLDEIQQQTKPAHISNIIDNLISNGIWSFGALIISLFAVVDLGLKFRINMDKLRGNASSKLLENLEITFSTSLNIIFLAVILYLLFIFSSSNGGVYQLGSQAEFAEISNRLGHIESQLELLTQGGNQGTPNNSFLRDEQIKAFLDQANMVVLAGLATSLFVNFLFMIGFGRRRVQPTQKAILPNFGLKEVFEQELLTAVLLALILALLPNSAEVFLLPLILHYFIFAFFEIIRLYPNLQIKKIVVKNYSLLILFAELSVWANFLNLLKQLYTDYIYSAWTLIHAANEASPQAVPIQVIIIFPLLTLIMAIPAWLNLRKVSKKEKIPAIIQSIQDLEKENGTSKT